MLLSGPALGTCLIHKKLVADATDFQSILCLRLFRGLYVAQ